MSDPMDLLRSNLSRVRIPEPTNRIYKQECCLSFDTPVNFSLPLVFRLVPEKKKDKQESVVRERKLIFLALCYSFVSFLFLFSFSLSFTALKLMCLLKCLFDDFSLFISVGCWENESVVGKESLSFCTIQISSLNFLGLPFFWFWGNIQIKIRNIFFFFCQTNCAFSPVQLVLKIWCSIIGTMLCVFVCFCLCFFSKFFSLSFFLSVVIVGFWEIIWNENLNKLSKLC